MSRKQAKRARFYARRQWRNPITVAMLRYAREILTANEDALDCRLRDMMVYGTGAVRIDENGLMTHIPYPELMAELDAIADQLEAP